MFFQKTKNKILLGAGIIFAAALVAFLSVFTVSTDDEFAQLNSKYGLVAVESLDESLAPRIASLFKPDFLRANLLDFDQPRQELILKLKGEESGSMADLRNVLVLNLRTDADIKKIAAEYSASKVVEFAEPNFELSADFPPAEIVDSSATKIRFAFNGEPVLVAVLDSGVDSTHPDFAGRIATGHNFLDDSTDVSDSEGHGTHTAGIILANSPAAKILPLKISDGSSGKMRELVEAIKFAVDHDVQVINLSLGLKKESRTLREAIDYARAKNVFVVAAAGNYRKDVEYFPAAWSDVFAVSGLTKRGKKLFLSNFGEWVDFSVVAQDVSAPAPGGEYAFRTGTSQAAPVVSAKIADFLSVAGKPSIFSEVENFLIESSELISGKYLLGRQILAVSE